MNTLSKLGVFHTTSRETDELLKILGAEEVEDPLNRGRRLITLNRLDEIERRLAALEAPTLDTFLNAKAEKPTQEEK